VSRDFGVIQVDPVLTVLQTGAAEIVIVLHVGFPSISFRVVPLALTVRYSLPRR